MKLALKTYWSISKYLNNHSKVYTVFGGNIGKVFYRIKSQSINVDCVPSLQTNASLIDDIKSIKKFIKLVKTYKPDIINCHSTKAALVARIAGLFTSVPVVFTVHGWGWRGLGISKKIIVYLISYSFRLLIDPIIYSLINSCFRINSISWIKNKS